MAEQGKPPHEGLTEEVVDDIMVDPDSPANSDRTPPQTTDAEPTSDDPPERVPGRQRD